MTDRCARTPKSTNTHTRACSLRTQQDALPHQPHPTTTFPTPPEKPGTPTHRQENQPPQGPAGSYLRSPNRCR